MEKSLFQKRPLFLYIHYISAYIWAKQIDKRSELTIAYYIGIKEMDFDDDSCECIEEDVLDPETIRKGKEILQTHTQTLGSQWICILY